MGRRLRQAREARGLAAHLLADRLRIGVEQLQALEAADRERLPEPVFVIAQARRIATALQVDITAELEALRASGELQPRPRPAALPPPRPVRAAPAPAEAAAEPPTNQLTNQLTERPADPPDPASQSTRRRPVRRLILLAGAVLLLGYALLAAGWRAAGDAGRRGLRWFRFRRRGRRDGGAGQP